MNSTHLFMWVGFVILTISRQIWYFYRLWHDRTAADMPSTDRDACRTYLLYAVYIAIWVGTIFTLRVSQPSIASYQISVLIFLAGVLLRWLGLKSLNKQFASHVAIRSDHELITKGIYAYIRHPIHLGMILELLGMSLLSQELWVWFLWILLLVVTHGRQLEEDKALEEAFGENAKAYQARIPSINLLVGLYRKLRR